MRVYCLTSLQELAPYAEDWDRLAADVPFRSWAWLSTWWKHYGGEDRAENARLQLFVPCVFDSGDRLAALAPWYLDRRPPQGSVLRMLGCGEVCSDYLSLLCRPDMEHSATAAIADLLTAEPRHANAGRLRWDLLELDAIDAADPAVGQLLGHLARRGCTVHHRDGPSCWRVELPATWDEYLAGLSKGHRKRLRRLEREAFGGGRAVLHSLQRAGELPRAAEMLVDLHQRRRRALGQPGCFASKRFAAFHREVMPRLLGAGQLQLHWLELDGRPAAAEYCLAAAGVVYAYQSGVEPELLDRQPGRLSTLAMLRWGIQQGYRWFDFLRGDEPYKARYGAAPRRCLAVRVVPGRTVAQLRHHAWLAGRNVKKWIRSGLRLVGTRGE